MNGLILSGSKNVFEVECDDGITRDCTIKGKILKNVEGYYNPLAPGDIVLATTQGLIETHSLRGEIFGKERIQKSLLENSRYSAEKMAKFTYDSLVQFTSKEIVGITRGLVRFSRLPIFFKIG